MLDRIADARVVAVALAGLLLAGCGGGPGGDQTPLTTCPGNQVILDNGQCGPPPVPECELPEVAVGGRCIVPDKPAPKYVPGPNEAVVYFKPPRSELRWLGAASVEQRLRSGQLGCRANHAARAGRHGGLQLRRRRHQLAGWPAAELLALPRRHARSHLRHLLGAATAGERRLRQLHRPRPHRAAANGGPAHQLQRGHRQSVPQHVLGGGGLHLGGERTARSAGGGGTPLHQRRLRGVRSAALGRGGSGGALDRFRHHRLGS